MPYNYLMSEEFGASDAWTLQTSMKIPNPEEAWDRGGKGKKLPPNTGPSGDKAKQFGCASILNNGRGVPFDCNPYPANAYQGFVNDVIENAVEYIDEPEEYQQLVQDAQTGGDDEEAEGDEEGDEEEEGEVG